MNILVPLQCQPANQSQPPSPPPDYSVDMIEVKETLGPSYRRNLGLPEQANNCNPETKTQRREREEKAAESRRQQDIVGEVFFRRAGSNQPFSSYDFSLTSILTQRRQNPRKNTPKADSWPPCRRFGVFLDFVADGPGYVDHSPRPGHHRLQSAVGRFPSLRGGDAEREEPWVPVLRPPVYPPVACAGTAPT